jgi:putative cell wall-binding protein
MVAAITVTALALAVIAPPAAAAAPAYEAAVDHETAGPITEVSQVVAESVPVDDPGSVVEYWTEERMRSARPLELELPLDEVAMRGLGLATAEDELVHETRRLTVEEVDRHPHASIGKVFFVLRGFNFVCSAAAVTSAGRWGEGSGQLVLTAGHCLSDGDGTFATHFVFVPGYHYDETWGEDYVDEDVAPSGRWAAERLFTTSEWHTQLGLGFARDVGLALVTGTEAYAGERLHDIVEPLDIAFTQPYPEDGLHLGVVPSIGMDYAIFGYGVANWGGEQQVRTLSAIDRSDPNFLPSPFGAPSTHTGGSSGGPWLFNYAEDQDSPSQNVVTGLNGYVYNGVDRIYSPQLDDRIHALWAYVNRVDTTTTVDAAPSPSVFGQPVTVTATVESADGMPTGSVTFTETTTDTVLGTGPLDDGGAAELTIDSLPVGTHTIEATYSGDDNFNPSTGTALHTTEGASTTTTVTSSPNPSVAGRSVTVTATVESADGMPTGSVTFTETTTDTVLGTGPLDDGGAAELTIDSLPVGTHTIEATYSGDDNFNPSTGTALHTTEGASTTTTVTSSPNPSVAGRSVTVTATVESADGMPTGSVTFTETTTDTVLGTGPLDDGGAAELTIDSLPVGTHTIEATYSGDDNFNPSTGTALHTTEGASTTTTVTSSPNPSVAGRSVTVTATVESADGMPTGSVTFTETTTDTVLGTGPLDDGGAAELTIDSLPVGTHTIEATYSGDDNFNPSTGTALHTTEGASTTTTVTSSPNPSVAGRSVTVTATVESADGMPTGSVTFTETTTDTVLGTGPLDDGGAAELTIDSLPVGTHTIEATYSGDDNFNPSSDTVTQTVEPHPRSITVVDTDTGADPVGQAIAWSRHAIPTSDIIGFAQVGARTVLLGRADLFADSLASGGAQGRLDAPLLLTGRDKLDWRVTEELQRLRADTVILLGGTAALSAEVASDLDERGYNVRRLAGSTRIETAVEIARTIAPTTSMAIVARAFPAPDGEPTQGFADALAAGALAADLGVPLLLTETDRLSAATASYLRQAMVTNTIVIGGTAAIGDEVLDELTAMGITPTRSAGATRFATATAIAATRGAATAADADGIILVDGGAADAWADAFPAALFASRTLTPIVLANGDVMPEATTAYLVGGNTTPLICGTSVSTVACTAAQIVIQRD